MSQLLRNLLVKPAQSPIRMVASLLQPPSCPLGTLPQLQYSVTASRQLRTSTSPQSPHRVPASSDTLLITEKATQRLKDILEQGSFLRVIVDSGGCSGFQYKFEIDMTISEEDIEIQAATDGKTMVVIDPSSLDILRGSTVDYETELIRTAFRIVNIPQAENGCSCGASFTVKID